MVIVKVYVFGFVDKKNMINAGCCDVVIELNFCFR